MLEVSHGANVLESLPTALNAEAVIELQRATDEVHADSALLDYVVSLASVTRDHPQIRVGLSPRGSLALVQCARGRALMAGRDQLIPEDLTESIEAVFLHRLVLRDSPLTGYETRARNLLEEVVRSVAVPR